MPSQGAADPSGDRLSGPPEVPSRLTPEQGTVPVLAAFPLERGDPVVSAGSLAHSPGDRAERGAVALQPGRTDLAAAALRAAPPWLASAAFHMSVLILVGLYLLPIRSQGQVSLQARTYAEQEGDQLDFDSPLAGNDKDQAEQPVLTPQNLPEVEDPFAAPAELETVLSGMTATSRIKAPQVGLALEGRRLGMKQSLLGRYGGNATTQAAVQLGLKWLARNQMRSGGWSLTGPYTKGTRIENDSAATAMALLAFQGDGHTHRSGTEFSPNVQRGLYWLLKEQDADGCFFHDSGFNHRFYTQGLCAIALCELHAMEPDDPTLAEPARQAIQYLLDSQSPQGGWRYQPRADSDVSVTGWVVMALQSARMARIEIPSDHFRRVTRYLDSVAQQGGSRYPYQLGHMPSPAMTAEALLCRQYLGWAREDERLVRGVEWITSPENLVNYRTNRNLYFWYYATQVAHHMEGEYWKRWNAAMRQAVPEQQVKQGREAGSWAPDMNDRYELDGGRLYVTCLSIYMLEVYYRHLPLYTKLYPTYSIPPAGKP